MRRASFLLLLSVSLSFACAKPNTRIELADGDRSTAPIPRAEIAKHPGEGRGPQVELIHLSASVTGLGDMLDAAEQLFTLWVPSEPGAPPLDFQSFMDVELVQHGFGPAWFASIDLDGLHTFDFEFPHKDQIDPERHVAATIASRSPGALVEGLPPTPRPELLEPGLWQLTESEDLRLLLRPRADHLEVANSLERLDSLGAARQALQRKADDPRLQLAVSNLDAETLALGPILDAQGVDPATRAAIIDAARFELDADFGRERDLLVRSTIVAPFGGAIVGGPLLHDPSPLAQLLPDGAWLVMVQSWATPATLGWTAEQLGALGLPSTLEAVARELLGRGDALVSQFGNEVAFAVYVDRKGHATLVFLSSVSDETAAKAALRELFASFESASAKLGPDVHASLQRDALRAGKHKADVLSIELPEDVRDLIDGMPWLLGSGKPTLEFGGLVAAGKLAIAVGAGQRDFIEILAPRLAGSAGSGLERGGGLATARALTGGCQSCVAIDPLAIADGLLAILAASPDTDRRFRKLLDDTRKQLLGLGLRGQLSVAASFDATRWAFALGVPKQLLFIKADVAARIRASFVAVHEGYERSGTPSNEEVCRHLKGVMEREMGDTNKPSPDDLERFVTKCVEDLDKERERIGAARFRKEAKCVLAAGSLEDMMKCEQV